MPAQIHISPAVREAMARRQEEKAHVVESDYDGTPILPGTSDEDFGTIWWSLWNDRYALEQSLQSQRAAGLTPGMLLEDEAQIHGEIAKRSQLLCRYYTRAHALGLI